MRSLNRREVFDVVRSALAEDMGRADITTKAIFPRPKKIQAGIIAKEQGVLAGIAVSMAAFKLFDPKIKFMPLILDGRAFRANEVIAHIEGDARAILSAERVALNFLSRLSGIATQTAQFVKAIKPHKTKIMDTRKTTPGLRALEKYAVGVGGGHNHRMGLYDQVLIKDNHLKALHYNWTFIRRAIKQFKKKGIITEIEVGNLSEFKEAIKLRPDIIMLDNMSLSEIKIAVRIRNKLPSTKLEASGGVNLRNVRAISSAGIDMISIGALTHSANPIDFSLEVES